MALLAIFLPVLFFYSLAMTHHEPEHDDEFLERIEKLCRERFPNAVLAREGMEIAI